MFLQQMFAVYGTGREGQASAAGAGGQEALYEGGHSPERRLRVAVSASGQMRDVTFIQNVMGSSGLGSDWIRAVFVEDWPP